MTKRDRTVIVIVLVLAAVVGSWMFVIQPRRDQAAKLGDQITAEQAQLASARAQVAQAQAAEATFGRNYTAVAGLGEAVPPDDNVPSLIYQLQNAAGGAQVDFRSLKLNPGAAASPVPTTPAAGATGGKTAATTPGAPATQAVTSTLPPGAAVGPAGFPTEPFTFTFQGNFFHLAGFFRRLDAFVVATNKRVLVSGRLMTLNAISLAAAKQGFPQITASISATTYLVPAGQGLMNGATPTGPSTPSTQSASAPASSAPAGAAVVTSPIR
jgi:type II secretory pathway pseudopilin PulG